MTEDEGIQAMGEAVKLVNDKSPDDLTIEDRALLLAALAQCEQTIEHMTFLRQTFTNYVRGIAV